MTSDAAYDSGVKFVAASAAVSVVLLAFEGLTGPSPARPADPPAGAGPTSPAAGGGGASALTVPEERDRRARGLIEALTFGDATLRAAATKKLLELGPDARRAVSDATRSDNPELRAAASEILNKLPWFLPDDAPDVRELLKAYGELPIERRRATVVSLAGLNNKVNGFGALFRLMQEEPSDDVKWSITEAVRECYRPEILAEFAKLKTADPLTPAPVLACVGHATFAADRAGAAKLFRRAIEADRDRPSDDAGEMGFAFDRLQFVLQVDGKYDQMGEVARLRAARATPEEGTVPAGVLELFALHGKLGPLAGFDKDLVAHKPHLRDARVMYCLAKAYDRTGQRVLATATRQGAFAAGIAGEDHRKTVGDFLMLQTWYDLAIAEYAARLASDDLDDLERGETHHRLFKAVAAIEDDAAAAEHIGKCVEFIHKAGRTFRGPTDQAMRDEMTWHQLRAAQKNGDKAAAQTLLAELTRYGQSPTNPDITIDLVPLLKEAGRGDEAKELFQKTYEHLKLQLASDPDAPMPRNNLAWLCARVGEHKADALKWAQEAHRMVPDNFAYMDTLAEAHLLNGNPAEAVRIERIVLKLRPNDVFLQKQMARFEAAAAKASQK